MSLFRRKTQAAAPVDSTLGDERAGRLLDAVHADDLDAVRTVLGEPAPPEVRERLTWLIGDVPGHMALFDRWAEQAPDEPDAWLARGAYGVKWAWEARGGTYAEDVGEDAFETFFDRLRQAEEHLLRASRLAPGDAVPWTHMLLSGRGLQVPVEE